MVICTQDGTKSHVSSWVRATIGYALVLTLCVSMSGCWIPENFDAKVTLNKDGSYTFTYDGTLAFALAVAATKDRALGHDGAFFWKMGGRDFTGSYKTSEGILTLRFPPVGATARGTQSESSNRSRRLLPVREPDCAWSTSRSRTSHSEPLGFPEEGFGPTSCCQTTDPQSLVDFSEVFFS
jgi:hypothetical protein